MNDVILRETADEKLCNVVELYEALDHWHEDVRVVALHMWVFFGGTRLLNIPENRN